jgi:flagellar motor protein MotB
MRISKILFKNALCAKSLLRPSHNLAATRMLAMNMHYRNFSTSSKAEDAEKSDRFDKNAQEGLKKESEELKKETEELRKEAEDIENNEKSEEKEGSSSSSESSDEETSKAKKEQDDKIKKLEQRVKDLGDRCKESEKSYLDLRNKYIYQLADNDNTVKRYKEEVNKTREFAITKFAKDLLNVRDDFHRAMEYADKFDLETCTEIDQ